MNIHDLPKIELHLHLDGSLHFETAAKLLNKSVDDIKGLMVAPSKCLDLNEYLLKFNLPVDLMQTKEVLIRAAHELTIDLENDNVIYAEIRFAPLKHTKEGLTPDEVVEAVLCGLKKSNVWTNLILCMMRDASDDENLKVIELAKKYQSKGVVALDLAGAESLYKTKSFAHLFSIANSYEIPFTIHAGEADGASSVDDAISFNAKRIGHGIRALENENTINRLKANNILVEICPTSNVQTNVVKDYENHPLKKLLEKGIKININTDNRTVSNTNLIQEYEHAINAMKIGINDIVAMNKDAIEASFLSNQEKEKLLNIYLEKLKLISKRGD